MEQNSFISPIKFYDDYHFPKGFSRSGDFTLNEAEMLTNCGTIIHQLINNEFLPESEEQKHFKSVILGTSEPLYQVEKVYLKYLNVIDKMAKSAATSKYSKKNIQDNEKDSDNYEYDDIN